MRYSIHPVLAVLWIACSPSSAVTSDGDGDGDGDQMLDASTVSPDASVTPSEPTFETHVLTRDGVGLHTRVLRPDATGSWPTLLVRSPFPIPLDAGPVYAWEPLVSEGYTLVVQSVRGTGDSGGTMDPLRQEIADGQDTVRWIAGQPWSNGRIAVLGEGYQAFAALAAAIDNPEVKVVLADGARGNAFTDWPGPYGNIFFWRHLVATGKDLRQVANGWGRETNDRPLVDLDIGLLGHKQATWRMFAPHADQFSDFWAERSLAGRLDQVCVPAIYFDVASEFRRGEIRGDAVAVFEEARSAPCNSGSAPAPRYVINDGLWGPSIWDVGGATPAGQLMRAYLKKYLKDEPLDLSSVPAVTYYVSGTNNWRQADTWPPPHHDKNFYLVANSPDLKEQLPSSDASQVYPFNPAIHDACEDWDNELGVAFWTAPLAHALNVAGSVELVAHIAVDSPDADLSAQLFELTAQGEIQWGHHEFVRLRFRNGVIDPQPAPIGQPIEVRVRFPATAHRFGAGSRIVLHLRPTQCGIPENTGTGGPIMTETTTQTTHTRLFTGPSLPSRLVLPITTL